MIITERQYKRIEQYLPTQRGNVSIENRRLINAILHMAANGGHCRNPAGSVVHGVYKHANRWAKNGALERLFLALQKEQIAFINVEFLHSTVHSP
ncbi:MAG: hypothetical protein LBQ00_05845 [Syntrophobacterales bacterium]|jgi:transposase|nr:hypothetical protein [Syntrophobacterales bacterium]